MTCEKCGCCEVHVYKPGTPDELPWSMCLWCADGVPCPNAQKKKKQAAAQKAAAAVEPPRHDSGVIHFAGASKVSRAYQPTPGVKYARPIPTTLVSNGDDVMPKNNIEELRSDLFDTLRSLKGKVDPIEIQRAKAICDVAGKIIDTGKLELAAMKKADNPLATPFFTETPALQPAEKTTKPPQLTNGKPV